MSKPYTPLDWYWGRSGQPRVFGSARQAFVGLDDAAFVAWSADGTAPTPWPRDPAGSESDAEMQAVLAPYGLSLPGFEAVPASVSSAQAKIALLRTPSIKGGKSLLEDVKAAVGAETTGEAQIWFDDARTWERTNPYVASLSAALELKAADIDALFVAAGKVAA